MPVISKQLATAAVSAATSRGQTLDEFGAEALQTANEETNEMLIVVRDGLPCVQPLAGTPQIDPVLVRRFVEECVF